MESLFIQLMYASQFQKADPYDWFCGPGSHICNGKKCQCLVKYFHPIIIIQIKWHKNNKGLELFIKDVFIYLLNAMKLLFSIVFMLFESKQMHYLFIYLFVCCFYCTCLKFNLQLFLI